MTDENPSAPASLEEMLAVVRQIKLSGEYTAVGMYALGVISGMASKQCKSYPPVEALRIIATARDLDHAQQMLNTISTYEGYATEETHLP